MRAALLLLRRPSVVVPVRAYVLQLRRPAVVSAALLLLRRPSVPAPVVVPMRAYVLQLRRPPCAAMLYYFCVGPLRGAIIMAYIKKMVALINACIPPSFDAHFLLRPAAASLVAPPPGCLSERAKFLPVSGEFLFCFT